MSISQALLLYWFPLEENAKGVGTTVVGNRTPGACLQYLIKVLILAYPFSHHVHDFSRAHTMRNKNAAGIDILSPL